MPRVGRVHHFPAGSACQESVVGEPVLDVRLSAPVLRLFQIHDFLHGLKIFFGDQRLGNHLDPDYILRRSRYLSPVGLPTVNAGIATRGRGVAFFLSITRHPVQIGLRIMT